MPINIVDFDVDPQVGVNCVVFLIEERCHGMSPNMAPLALEYFRVLSHVVDVAFLNTSP